MKAVAVFLKLNFHAMCLLLEITTILRGSDIQILLETFCSMEVELARMGFLNGAVEGQLHAVQGERHQRSLAIKIEKGCEGRRHWTCVQIV